MIILRKISYPKGLIHLIDEINVSKLSVIEILFTSHIYEYICYSYCILSVSSINYKINMEPLYFAMKRA